MRVVPPGSAQVSVLSLQLEAVWLTVKVFESVVTAYSWSCALLTTAPGGSPHTVNLTKVQRRSGVVVVAFTASGTVPCVPLALLSAV